MSDSVAGDQYYVAYDKARTGEYTSVLYTNRAAAEQEIADGMAEAPEVYEGATVGTLAAADAGKANAGTIASTDLPVPAGAPACACRDCRSPEQVLADVEDLCNTIAANEGGVWAGRTAQDAVDAIIRTIAGDK